MSNKPRSTAQMYYHAALRKYIWNVASKNNKYYLVSEFPKSGGTWFCKMLSDYLAIPFARNTSRPSLGSSVIHGHEPYKSYNDNMALVIRDGRDVMVSFYYHHLFYSDWNHHRSISMHRKKLNFKDFDNIHENLPKFIEYLTNDWGKKKNHFTWGEFNRLWVKELGEARVVKYEDLLSRCHEAMSVVLMSLGESEIDKAKLDKVIDANSFEKVTGRKRGDENNQSFARKGIAGDWRNQFSKEAKEVFSRYYNDDLIFHGYEVNDSWISG